MNVIRMPHLLRKRNLPIVALLDLQVEYVSEGRAHYLASAQAAAANCRILLETARKLRLPIAHFRLLQSGHFFNRASAFAHWIEELKPRASEYVYEHGMPSCFSNPSFGELMDGVDQPEIIMAGLSGERACLSTAVESFHRGYLVTFVHDCSASAIIGDENETSAHAAAVSMISVYAEVVSLKQVLNRLDGMASAGTSG